MTTTPTVARFSPRISSRILPDRRRLPGAWPPEGAVSPWWRWAHGWPIMAPYQCKRTGVTMMAAPGTFGTTRPHPGPRALHPTRLGGNQPSLRGGLCHQAKLMSFLGDGAAAHHVAHRRLDHHLGGLALLHVGVEHLHPGHLLPPRPIALELEAPVGCTAEMRAFKLGRQLAPGLRILPRVQSLVVSAQARHRRERRCVWRGRHEARGRGGWGRRRR